MTTPPLLAPELTFAVIGAGRLGPVLVDALRAAGFTVHGPLRRSDEFPHVDVALLAVPDASIADLAVQVRGRANKVGHLSGATGLERVDFSLHPLQTFTGSENPEVFRGIGAAVAGRTPADTQLADGIATAIGARAFAVDDAHRAAYHAAASFASNFVLTVLDAAEELAVAAGIDKDEARELLAPLVRQTVANWQASGARGALTGPIARGDEATVQRQRDAIADGDILTLFEALATATLRIADQQNQMPEAQQ